MKLSPIAVISLGGAFLFFSITTIVSSPLLSQTKPIVPFALTDDMYMMDIFERLGKIRMHKVDTTIKGYSVERGKDIVEKGWTKNEEGKKTKVQSKYFVCTSCHNTSKEFPTLIDDDPQLRLDFAAQNKLPFLQGTSFWGIVHRETFFNGDYQKKYANTPEITIAHQSLRKAIQFCATQHAKGRTLEAWEMESVLAYLWTFQYKIGDLKLTADEKEKIESAITTQHSSARAINIMEDKFIKKIPATFATPMPYRTLDSQKENDEKRFNNGKLVYDLGCKHCHSKKRYSVFILDDSPKTFRLLDKQLRDGDEHSIYKVTRNGTQLAGKMVYMPPYTTEKMSDTQIEDLRIYIQKKAKESLKQ